MKRVRPWQEVEDLRRQLETLRDWISPEMFKRIRDCLRPLIRKWPPPGSDATKRLTKKRGKALGPLYWSRERNRRRPTSAKQRWRDKRDAEGAAILEQLLRDVSPVQRGTAYSNAGPRRVRFTPEQKEIWRAEIEARADGWAEDAERMAMWAELDHQLKAAMVKALAVPPFAIARQVAEALAQQPPASRATGILDRTGAPIHEGDVVSLAGNMTADDSMGSLPNGWLFDENDEYEVHFDERIGKWALRLPCEPVSPENVKYMNHANALLHGGFTRIVRRGRLS